MSALGQKRTYAVQQIAGYSITSSAIESTPDGTSLSPSKASHWAKCGRVVAGAGRTVPRAKSIQDTTASGGISGRLSITLSTKPKSLAISAVIK